MRPDALAMPIGRQRLGHLILGVWAALLIGVCARAALRPGSNSVYPLFSAAGQRWIAGEDVYQTPPLGYRYSPAVTVWFVPLSFLPDAVGGVLWRLLNAAVFFAGVACWYRRVVPGGEAWSAGQTAALWLLIVPLSLGSLNNGQSNALVVGLLLIASYGAVTERWNLAAFGAAAATLLKIYPAAAGLLLMILYPRRFAGRFVAFLAAGLALPFLFQHSDYVLGAYRDWAELLGAEDRRSGFGLNMAYRDLWLLFWIAGVTLSNHVYLMLQLGTAAAIAGLCVAGRRAGWTPRQQLTTLLNLAGCWMLLLGPATESCTYILLAPLLAAALIDAWQPGGTTVARVVLVAAFVLTLANPIALWVPGGNHLSKGLQPLATLLVFGLFLAQTVRSLLPAQGVGAGPADVKGTSLALFTCGTQELNAR